MVLENLLYFEIPQYLYNFKRSVILTNVLNPASQLSNVSNFYYMLNADF